MNGLRFSLSCTSMVKKAKKFKLNFVKLKLYLLKLASGFLFSSSFYFAFPSLKVPFFAKALLQPFCFHRLLFFRRTLLCAVLCVQVSLFLLFATEPPNSLTTLTTFMSSAKRVLFKQNAGEYFLH